MTALFLIVIVKISSEITYMMNGHGVGLIWKHQMDTYVLIVGPSLL